MIVLEHGAVARTRLASVRRATRRCWRVALGAAVVALASGGRAAPGTDLDALRNTGADRGFALADTVPTLEFPRDHGPHPRFRHEWWYVTGNLDGGGRRFGFELTFFRIALAPPLAGGPESSASSAWRARQIYVAHFAITDVETGEFHFFQKMARDALDLGGAGEGLNVAIDDWRLCTRGPGCPGGSSAIDIPRNSAASPSHADRSSMGIPPEWFLQASGADYDLALSMQPLGAPVPNGDHGLSRKSDEPGAASIYYSVPRIDVHGSLSRDGRTFAVKGLAWLDREWGSGSLGRRQEGWDWYALQLADGSSLMFYSLRDRGGARDAHSAGTWIEPDGSVRPLSSADLESEVTGYWTSPHGGRYPARWHVRVPSVGLDVDVRPVLADQELGTRPRYWEGAVDVRGARHGTPAAGRGYVELVGYGE